MDWQSFADGRVLTSLRINAFAETLLQFDGCVLLEELFDSKIASADPDIDLAVVDLDAYLLGAKAVDARIESNEHDLELALVRDVVEIIGECHVDRIALDRDVDSCQSLKLLHLLLQLLQLLICLFELLEQLVCRQVRFVDSLLLVQDVVAGIVQFLLELSFLLFKIIDHVLMLFELLLEVILDVDKQVELLDFRLQFEVDAHQVLDLALTIGHGRV